MKHQLTEIREAAVALLKNGFERVYSGRAHAPAQLQLPCVVVYCDGRNSDVFNDAPVTLKHTAQLVTVVCVQANEQADDLAEEMLGKIEGLFYANPTLRRISDGLEINALADDLLPESLQISHDDSGEYVSLFYQQAWRAVYFDDCGDYVGVAAEFYPQAEIGAEIGNGALLAANWQIYGSNPEIDAADLTPKGQQND